MKESLMVGNDDPRGPAWEALQGMWRFSAVYAMIELRIPDHLDGAARTADELAKRCDADPDALRRLLRSLESHGFLARTADDTYALTPAGACLRSGVEGSLRPAFSVNGEPASWRAMSGLTDVVRTGKSAFVTVNGTSMYDHYAANPELGKQFDLFMRTRSADLAQAITAAYDFAGTTTLVDVGGGAGTIIATILGAHPELRGVLFDMPRAEAAARAYLAERGVADRCAFVGGDFFADLPDGDTYLLANVVHNLPDDQALKVLSNVAAHAGRVLLADVLVPDDDRPHYGKDLDVRMLAMFGSGGERSSEEYVALVESAGLAVETVIDLPQSFSLVVARAA